MRGATMRKYTISKEYSPVKKSTKLIFQNL